MSKGSGSRKFNKEGERKLRANPYWKTCEFELKKKKA